MNIDMIKKLSSWFVEHQQILLNINECSLNIDENSLNFDEDSLNFDENYQWKFIEHRRNLLNIEIINFFCWTYLQMSRSTVR
jgi:hypothetical protein